ncbi:MAG: hypothetical protein DME88_11000 [Verrucomicrobia bacterium]|jgi:hypothetical protein|nr:MAG: hypothetical protein DME88_11000 [Verrucomicrobiota bacterium]
MNSEIVSPAILQMRRELRAGEGSLDGVSRPREIAPSSSRSCRWEKNAKAKREWLKFSRSLSIITVW